MPLDPDYVPSLIGAVGAVVVALVALVTALVTARVARGSSPPVHSAGAKGRTSVAHDGPLVAPKRGVRLAPALAAGTAVLGLAVWSLWNAGASDEITPVPQPTVTPSAASTVPSSPDPTQSPPVAPVPALLEPVSVSASATKEAAEQRCTGEPVSYAPQNLLDGDADTGWGAAADDGVGSSFVVAFEGPVRLLEVGLTPGYLKEAPRKEANCISTSTFPFNRRIPEVRYDYDDGSSTLQRFTDNPAMQTMSADVVTTQVEVTILETVRPPGADNDTIISDVLFKGVPQ